MLTERAGQPNSVGACNTRGGAAALSLERKAAKRCHAARPQLGATATSAWMRPGCPLKRWGVMKGVEELIREDCGKLI